MTAPTSARGALVTGAAQRIGRAIALGLANDGWHPVVHYHRSADAAAETVAAIEGRGGTATAIAADLADPNAASALMTARACPTAKAIQRPSGDQRGTHCAVDGKGRSFRGLRPPVVSTRMRYVPS